MSESIRVDIDIPDETQEPVLGKLHYVFLKSGTVLVGQLIASVYYDDSTNVYTFLEYALNMEFRYREGNDGLLYTSSAPIYVATEEAFRVATGSSKIRALTKQELVGSPNLGV